MRLTNISSPLGVCWRSLTNSQGLPRHRLPLMLSQNVSMPVLSRHAYAPEEMTPDTDVTQPLCGLCWARLGRCQPCYLSPGGWHRQTGVLAACAYARGYRRVGHYTTDARAPPPR